MATKPTASKAKALKHGRARQGSKPHPNIRANAAALGLTTYQAQLVHAASTDPNRMLTEKQIAFAKERAKGESIQTSAIRAGFANPSEGHRLIAMPAIKNLIAKEQAHYESAAQMTRKKVMDGFLESIEMAKLMAEPSTMVSGWREIAKMCGYYAPVEKKITFTADGGRARMEKMTDEELEKLVGTEIPSEILEAIDDERDAQGED